MRKIRWGFGVLIAVGLLWTGMAAAQNQPFPPGPQTGGLPQCLANLAQAEADLAACLAEPISLFPASGQTSVFQADKNNGAGLDNIDDDGTVQAGAPLSYTDNEDGTITDNNTGLMWEMKDSLNSVEDSNNLHDADNRYRWSGDGSQETIWDWLDDVNAEDGTGFAEYIDWRIPNMKELTSIVDYERGNPSIDPLFGPTAASTYWSSTTGSGFPGNAWAVLFRFGFPGDAKSGNHHIRAVRGGL